MKILALLIGCLLGKNNYRKIYPSDPKSLIYKNYVPNDDVLKRNGLWIDYLNENRTQSYFVSQMINVPNVVPITPDTAFTILDDSPFCWAILVYDSSKNGLYEEIIELAHAMSTHFYQRVTVGVLDLAYPSNHDTFGDLFQEVPSLLIKHPRKIHQAFYHDEDFTKERDIRHTRLDLWGEVIPKVDLIQNPMESFQKIDSYYDESHETYKVGAVFMHHYNITEAYADDTTSGRRSYYTIIFKEIMKRMQQQVVGKARKIKADADESLGPGKMGNEEIYEFMMHEMDLVLTNTNMMKEIEEMYETQIKELQEDSADDHSHLLDPKSHPKIDLTPEPPADIKPKITKWLRLRTEL